MGRHLPRSIRMDREQKRLHDLAQTRGYDTLAIMLHELYVVQRVPIQEIANTLVTPLYTLRKLFDDFQITVRTRGGRNHVRVEVTQELYDEACRDGLSATADRIGIDAITLNSRLKRWLLENPQ